jgi:hypothetical protein
VRELATPLSVTGLPKAPPGYASAYAAFDAGDLDGAIAAFRRFAADEESAGSAANIPWIASALLTAAGILDSLGKETRALRAYSDMFAYYDLNRAAITDSWLAPGLPEVERRYAWLRRKFRRNVRAWLMSVLLYVTAAAAVLALRRHTASRPSPTTGM